MPDPQLDDIDALFARTGLVEPPEDLLARVIAQARVDGALNEPAVRRSPALYAGAYVLALLSLAVLAYELGLAIAGSGTTSLVSVLASDGTLLRDAPAAYFGALLASLPWLHVAGVFIDLAILGVVTSLAVRVAGTARSSWAAGPAARAPS
ncbi:MAG TPA: hypothetical protein VK821_02205 [Dehalococcoidia bacterium]|nr:hypothetical protein [Dehalococcoidia bacterium]